jgi:hypothetical protein
MGFWKCSHKNANTGERLSTWHTGNQCTSESNQSNDCFLYNPKGWDFVSCKAEYGKFVRKGVALRLVSENSVKKQKSMG